MGDYNYYESTPNNNGGNGYSNYNPYGQPEKKPKKERPFMKKLMKALALGLAFGLVAGLAFQGSSYLLGQTLGTEEDSSSAAASAAQLSTSDTIGSTSVSSATTVTDVSDIVENVMPAIVQVTSVSLVEYQSWFRGTYSYESTSAGSGVIISQDDSYVYIVTNNHVVSGAEELTITFDDESAVEAEIQGTRSDMDLAVVRVAISDIDSSTLSAIKVATIGSSENLSVGESAVVIGNALGYGQSVTTGVISALNRQVELEGDNGETITNELIQTDAAVNPGNSGGALINMSGELVGIVSAKYSDTSVEGMGYAIPIDDATSVIEDLISGTAEDATGSSDQAAYLGISGLDVSSKVIRQYNLPENTPSGACVLYIQDGSAADTAGINKYDVITSFNGVAVSSFQEIQNLMSSLHAGDQVDVNVCRYNDNYRITETLTVTLGAAESN